MKYSGLKIGTIPVTAKLLLYTLFTVSVISGVIGNVLLRATQTSNFLDPFIISPISLFGSIGFFAIILEVAKKWHRVGGAILLGIALFILFSLPSGYNEEIGLFHDYPYLIAPALVSTVSWAISGVIIIVSGKFLSIRTSDSKVGFSG